MVVLYRLVTVFILAQLCAIAIATTMAQLLPHNGVLVQVTATLPQQVIYHDMNSGHEVTVYTLPSDVTRVVAAPQGYRVAIADIDQQITVYNFLNGHARVFDSPYRQTLLADWHADQLTIISVEGTFTMNVNTGAFTPLTDETIRYLDTSVEQTLAYTTRYGLFLRQSDDERGWMLRRMSMNTPVYSEPVFSPDGNQLAFVADNYEQARRGIFVYNMENQSMKKVSQGAFSVVNHPAWSPDGTYIVYQHITRQHSQIYSLNLHTGQQTVIAEGAPSALLAWMR
ncbi:MAG: hypothetical protein AAF787_16840 [Chloroflexota bacterium]